MLLDDPLERRRITFPVPRAFGIDDGNRSAFADLQAVGLAAKDAALIGQAKLFQTALQVVPRDDTALEVTTLRLGLFSAEKNVTTGDWDADRDGDFLLCVGHEVSAGPKGPALRV